jgi:hypothetical protein
LKVFFIFIGVMIILSLFPSSKFAFYRCTLFMADLRAF